jgi:hypothetical protein
MNFVSIIMMHWFIFQINNVIMAPWLHSLYYFFVPCCLRGSIKNSSGLQLNLFNELLRALIFFFTNASIPTLNFILLPAFSLKHTIINL